MPNYPRSHDDEDATNNAAMSSKESFLNFFWSGQNPPLTNLFLWAKRLADQVDTDFKVRLWVDTRLFDELRKRNDVTVIKDKIILRTQQNQTIHIQIENIDPLIAEVRLQYPTLVEFYQKMILNQLYAFASDFARMVILNKHPGIYCDFDIKPKPNAVFPKSMDALRAEFPLTGGFSLLLMPADLAVDMMQQNILYLDFVKGSDSESTIVYSCISPSGEKIWRHELNGENKEFPSYKYRPKIEIPATQEAVNKLDVAAILDITSRRGHTTNCQPKEYCTAYQRGAEAQVLISLYENGALHHQNTTFVADNYNRINSQRTVRLDKLIEDYLFVMKGIREILQENPPFSSRTARQLLQAIQFEKKYNNLYFGAELALYIDLRADLNSSQKETLKWNVDDAISTNVLQIFHWAATNNSRNQQLANRLDTIFEPPLGGKQIFSWSHPVEMFFQSCRDNGKTIVVKLEDESVAKEASPEYSEYVLVNGPGIQDAQVYRRHADNNDNSYYYEVHIKPNIYAIADDGTIFWLMKNDHQESSWKPMGEEDINASPALQKIIEIMRYIHAEFSAQKEQPQQEQMTGMGAISGSTTGAQQGNQSPNFFKSSNDTKSYVINVSTQGGGCATFYADEIESVSEGLKIKGRNNKGEELHIILNNDGSTQGNDEGVFYNSRADIFRHFKKELPQSHEVSKISKK